jgi:hypothetical protein
MTETEGDGRSWIRKAAWLGGGVVVVAAIVLSITFAVTHKNGNSGPGDVPPGNIQPQSNVLVSDNCGASNDEGFFEPATIQLACGDGTVVAGNLTWSQWGSTTAVGQGSVNEVSCVPDCADGKDVAYKAELTLSEPVKAGSGKEYFTRIKVSFTGSRPNGSSSQLFKDCYDTPPAPYIPSCPADEQGAN